MAFHEIELDSGLIILGTDGGPAWETEITPAGATSEQAAQIRAAPLGRWNYGDRIIRQSELDALRAFFHARRGRAHGFRLRVLGDHRVSNAQGYLGIGGAGTGVPTLECHRHHADSANAFVERIRKLAAGVVVERAGSVVSSGITIDVNVGTVTWVADAQSNVSSITPGSSTVVTLLAALSGLVVGGRLYLSGVTGTAGTPLNNLAHAITGVAGAAYTISTSTAGLSGSGGTGWKYPQPSETTRWVGEYRRRVRFDADQLRTRLEAYDPISGEALHYLHALPIVEIDAG